MSHVELARSATVPGDSNPIQVEPPAPGSSALLSHGPDRIRTLGPGGWFGELALLDPGARRTATVTAGEPVRLVIIDQHTFLTALAGASMSRTVADDHARDHYR